MALSCIVCEIQRLIGRKSQNFNTPPVFSGPAEGDSIGISRRCLIFMKLEWLVIYCAVKRLWQYVKRFSQNTGTQRTDGQTDVRTDRLTELLWRATKLTNLNENNFRQYSRENVESRRLKYFVYWLIILCYSSSVKRHQLVLLQQWDLPLKTKISLNAREKKYETDCLLKMFLVEDRVLVD